MMTKLLAALLGSACFMIGSGYMAQQTTSAGTPPMDALVSFSFFLAGFVFIILVRED